VSVVDYRVHDRGQQDADDGTVRYPSLEVRDMVLGSGMATGAGVNYDRLEELVAKLQRA
jgi:hypothetical protein